MIDLQRHAKTMATKNNPKGDRVNISVLVEPDLFDQFDSAIKERCLQKTAVLRRLISDFSASGQFQSEQSK